MSICELNQLIELNKHDLHLQQKWWNGVFLKKRREFSLNLSFKKDQKATCSYSEPVIEKACHVSMTGSKVRVD
jgi:hypothetical protein